MENPAGWREAQFSERLAEAVNRHDYNEGLALLKTLEDHLARRGTAYPSGDARKDLKALRGKRQFLLMRRYAEAVMKSGTHDAQVRRQHGQALIELKELDRAQDVLSALAADLTPPKDDDSRTEQVEARGLLGRARKQRYVDQGRRDGREIEAAVKEYATVFSEDAENVWHGINAATCILCGIYDGHSSRTVEEGRSFAARVLDVLKHREAKAAAENKRLDVWDYASRVEALVDLGRFDEAEASLDDYLRHPKMNAFEVSSTFRQFDEVMRLGDSEKGQLIHARLARAAERLRSGGIAPIDEKGTRAMLVRVADPSWTGAGIPDLDIRTRMGTVIAVTGSARTVQALLKDPIVIAVDESRPGGPPDCDKSVPFINVRDEYKAADGNYSERGKGVLIAVIDNGIDVLHQAFLDDQGNSRIVGIWDQRDAGKPHPDGFDFGRYYDADDIAGFVSGKAAVPALLAKAGDGHGTHVASIAAGRKTAKFAGGVAPEAKLLIVLSAGDEPTGYSHTHLAALDFIAREATRRNMPVVVNVSQGMNAGAHDGMSPLEIAFDNFAFPTGVAKPGRVVVKSAGNEREKHGHAEFTVPPPNSGVLKWRCPLGSPPVLIELWWKGGNEYSFTLESPSGNMSPVLDSNNPDIDEYFKGHGQYQMQLVPNHPQNGHNLVKLTVDNGVAATKPTDWKLRVTAVRGIQNPTLHAWIERNSSPNIVEFVNNATEGLTLSIPGTSRSVVTVAAIGAKDPVEIGDFSSHGPTFDERYEKPDVAAPGVGVFAACAGSVDDVTKLDGTSQAAPHVTGAIALVFSKRLRTGKPLPTAMQLLAKLHSEVKYPLAEWDAGQGYGVIDVEKLLAAF